MLVNCLLLFCLFIWYKYQLQHRTWSSKAYILCLVSVLSVLAGTHNQYNVVQGSRFF